MNEEQETEEVSSALGVIALLAAIAPVRFAITQWTFIKVRSLSGKPSGALHRALIS